MSYISSNGKAYETFEEMMKGLLADYKAEHNLIYRFLDHTWIRLNDLSHEYSNKVKFAFQRLDRGYDNLALWNLDNFIADKVGNILVTLSKEAVSWPGEPIVSSYEEWQSQLAKAGNALLIYNKTNHYGEDEEKVMKDARQALHWVADHFGMLWD